MDNSRWLKNLIDKTEHRAKRRVSYFVFLKSNVVLKRMLLYVFLFLNGVALLEVLCYLGVVSSSLSPVYYAEIVFGVVKDLFLAFFKCVKGAILCAKNL
ncbi:MAG: hypothetical protein HEEMFOPI_01052 [Holosporales bacterium]